MKIEMIKSVVTYCSLFITIFINLNLAWSAPNSITFQSKIVKPNGQPLEASSVSFRMTIADTVGSCVIFQEDFANRNMSGTSGLISLTLGSGTKIFPLGPMTLTEVFNNYNSPAFNCQGGGIINAGVSDRRKLILQFNDGSGWQTVPAMDINSTPFSMQALVSHKLGDYPAQDYLRPASLPSCVGGEALHFNGASFTCVATGGGSGSVTSVSSGNGDITITNGTTTPQLTLNSGTGANQIVKQMDRRNCPLFLESI